MSEELVYDPRTKQMIKDKIYRFLYDPVRADFQKRLNTLIHKNSRLLGNNQRWMLFRAEEYTAENPGPRPRPINKCHADIKPMMQDYIDGLKQLNDTELPYVLGFINRVLNSSNSLQDYFKVFPQSLHQPIRDLIDQCACRSEYLPPEKVKRLQEENAASIELIKKRMVLNLLL